MVKEIDPFSGWDDDAKDVVSVAVNADVCPSNVANADTAEQNTNVVSEGTVVSDVCAKEAGAPSQMAHRKNETGSDPLFDWDDDFDGDEDDDIDEGYVEIPPHKQFASVAEEIQSLQCEDHHEEYQRARAQQLAREQRFLRKAAAVIIGGSLIAIGIFLACKHFF